MTPNVIPGTRRFDLPDSEIAARYDAGEPIDELAASYGVSSPVIYGRLREQGRSLRLPRLTAAQRAQILDLFQSGLSGSAIAKQMGIARSSVRKVLRAADMKRPTHVEVAAARVCSDEVQQVVRRHQGGETLRSLADEFGIPRSTLARWVARAEGDSTGCA